MNRIFRASWPLLAGVALLAVDSVVKAGPPTSAFQIPDVSVSLELTRTSYTGGQLGFQSTFVNNTAKDIDVEALFGPPLAGHIVHLPAKPAGKFGVHVPAAFADGDPPLCGTRDYSAQAQNYTPYPTIRVTSTCTFGTNVVNARVHIASTQPAVYVDSLAVETPPVCRTGGDFIVIRATAFNHASVNATGLVMQLLAPNGSLLGKSAPFDLKAGDFTVKTVSAAVAVQGKLDVKLADPKSSAGAALVNTGVYVEVTPSCAMTSQPVQTSAGVMATGIAPH